MVFCSQPWSGVQWMGVGCSGWERGAVDGSGVQWVGPAFGLQEGRSDPRSLRQLRARPSWVPVSLACDGRLSEACECLGQTGVSGWQPADPRPGLRQTHRTLAVLLAGRHLQTQAWPLSMWAGSPSEQTRPRVGEYKEFSWTSHANCLLASFLFKDSDPSSAFLTFPHPDFSPACSYLPPKSRDTGCQFPNVSVTTCTAEAGAVAPQLPGSTHVCSEETETVCGDVTVPRKGFCSREKRQEVERTGVPTDARWEPHAGTRTPGALLG